jgi:hypothetical protein
MVINMVKYINMILSIDIGLRNLALCCMSAENPKDVSTYKIHLWDVYNTLNSDDYKCEGIQKNGKICGKKCSFKYTLEDKVIHSCKTHFPKTLDCKSKKHVFKKKAIKDYLLQDIAKVVLCKLQEIYDNNLLNLNITSIIIELQPKINRKAVFTSHIIYGKLVELYKDSNVPIKFIRASQKLKCYTGPKIECKLKGAYAQRKWLSVEYCKWFLENKFAEEESVNCLQIFSMNSKQDDLSDTFCMAINALFGIPKKKYISKKKKN